MSDGTSKTSEQRLAEVENRLESAKDSVRSMRDILERRKTRLEADGVFGVMSH